MVDDWHENIVSIADVERFIESIKQVQKAVHWNAVNKGFWEDSPNKAEKICLMHSELSEMLEGVRKPGPDHHCPEFTNEEIELADNFIRGMDYAEKFNLRLAQAIIAKMIFNQNREYKHGKKF